MSRDAIERAECHVIDVLGTESIEHSRVEVVPYSRAGYTERQLRAKLRERRSRASYEE